MYCFIDETGHTGSNLFDSAQPEFLYGFLTSPMNLDADAFGQVSEMRRKLSIDGRIHANELGENRLELVAADLLSMQKEFAISFETIALHKSDYAVMSFFDQVFDSGNNDVVPSHVYYSRWKYIFLFKLADFFDTDLSAKAWQARITQNQVLASTMLVEICEELIKRIGSSSQSTSIDRNLVSALLWAKKNPLNICYNAVGKNSLNDISPNLIAFQPIIQRISDIAKSCEIKSITVDRQQQFGSNQRLLLEYYQMHKDLEIPWPADLPQMNLSSIPSLGLNQVSSTVSVGLELVDVYLWLAKRSRCNKLQSQSLQEILNVSTAEDQGFEISIRALKERYLHEFHNVHGL